jgi:hypothetical protein
MPTCSTSPAKILSAMSVSSERRRESDSLCSDPEASLLLWDTAERFENRLKSPEACLSGSPMDLASVISSNVDITAYGVFEETGGIIDLSIGFI